jgi:pimeloyl-ACP methyl ester carboxylesterase
MPSLNKIFIERKQYLPGVIEILRKKTTAEIEVDGVRLKIDYRRIVIPSLKKHSIPFVLSCGWGSGWEGIVPLAFSFACEGFEVFIISLPGYGDSDNLPPEMITPNILELMAKIVIKFLKCLNIPRAPVIGHSMAAIIAMKAARKEPMLVEKVVLLNAGGIRQYRNIFSKILMAKRFILSGVRLHLRYKWMSFLSKEDDYIIELVSWCGKQKSPFGKGRLKQRIVEFLDICRSCLLEDAKKAPFTFVVYIAGAKDTVFNPFEGKELLLEAISRHGKVGSSVLAEVPHNPTLFHSEITAAAICYFLEE